MTEAGGLLVMDNPPPRSESIGSSDIAAILGLNPYRTALEVYLEKIGEMPEWEGNRRTRLGKFIEPWLAEEWALERKVDMSDVEAFRTRAVFPADDRTRRATPDFLWKSRNRLVEGKSVGLRQADRWGNPETDEVPEEYLLQGAWQLDVTGCEAVEFVAHFGQDDVRIYVLDKDLELQGHLREVAAQFWRDHVVKRVPPEVKSSEGMERYFKTRLGRDSGETRDATPEEVLLCRKLGKKRELAKILEKEVEDLAAAVQFSMKTTALLLGPDFRVSWKTGKGRATTDWATVVLEAKVSPELVELHTHRTPTRSFRPTFAGQKDED